jgi:cellulose synthase operon protein C
MPRAVQTVAIARCPGCDQAYVRRGDLAFEAGDLDAAVADWERALALQPQNVDLRLRLAALQSDSADAFDTLRLSLDEIVTLAAEAESSVSAGFVTLVDQRFVSLQPSGLASTWTQQAWRIDTRVAADELRTLSVSYTPDAERVERIELVVVKPDGRQERAIATDDFNAQSGPAAMYFDLRVRRWDVNNLEEGDVLIAEWRTDDIAYRNLFDDYFGDVWLAQSPSPRVLSRYAIERPASRVLYDNRASLDDAVVTDQETDAGVLTVFEWRDVPGIVLEPGAPGLTEVVPFVSISSANEWSALADWYWDLVENQLVTSTEIEETVEALVAGVTDPVERVQRIYAYVVRNTRYVGLEFGIHGYKPYRTTECFARRFGDCKDTASLLKVMLELAGIPTHLVLVRTRDRGRVGAFPPSLAVFNHAIAYVPSLGLYLDGTAAFSGALELPTGDQGASALIVEDGQGGTFLEIPASPASVSEERFEVVVDLRDAPSGNLLWSTSGTLAASMRRWAESTGDLVAELQRELGRDVIGIEVLEVEPSEPSDIDSPVLIAATFEGGQWTTGAGADITLHPLTSDANWVRRLAGRSTRTLPLEFSEAWSQVSEYRIRVPASWQLRSALQTVQSESPFGTWSYAQSLDDDGWLHTRFEVTFDVIRLTPEQYPEFRAWLSEADAVASSRLQFEDTEAGQ